MGEWLNQRSAKPSTAVRIRFRPPKTSLQVFVEGFLVFYALFYAPFVLILAGIRLLDGGSGGVLRGNNGSST